MSYPTQKVRLTIKVY